MLLGTRNLTAGDTRRIEVSYREFLPSGVSLSSPSVTIITTPTPTSTLGTGTLAPVLDVTNTILFFFVIGGSAVNENFTVQVQVHDQYGEIINDTIDFTVVAP